MMFTPPRLATLSRELYGELGAAVAAHFLRCDRCGADQYPSRDDMARYFREGWPQCCGETMRLTAYGEVSDGSDSRSTD